MNPFIKEICGLLEEPTGLKAGDIAAALTTPPDSAMGDFAFPCFPLAKVRKAPPAKIAAEIAAALKPTPLLTRIEARGPYLNFFVERTAWLREVLGTIFQEGDKYGASQEGKGKTIVFDYSAPNVAKEFRIFHLRTTVLGNALYNLYRMLGYRCVGINHLGDWGTQFGVVLAAFEEKGDEKKLAKDPIRYLTGLYVEYNRRMGDDGALKGRAREWLKKLEDGDAEARRLWRLFVDLSVEDFKRVYKRLGVRFDYYRGESFYFEKTDEVIREAEEKGIAEVSEGALVIKMRNDDLPPIIIRKSDGATTYVTRDMAAAKHRYEEFEFDRMLYVVGSEQKLHFEQLFEALERMGYEWAKRCLHIPYGIYLELQEVDGETRRVKAGTRGGFKVLLEEVLDEAADRAERIIDENYEEGFFEDKRRVAEAVGIGAIIFNDLKNTRIKDVVFDWDSMLSFRGETGPYLQYAHARICGILRKWGGDVRGEVDFALLDDPEEFEMSKLLARYPDVIRRAAETYEPSALAGYLLEIATAFNKYYTDLTRHRVADENAPDLSAARILMADCIRRVLASGLTAIGVRPLERM
ncbi:MAG: arginine--tRNA ligase [Planctomycetota bacterium]|nr:MAG: arginine--tRNA ligase [Planctomycetota bacterium]